MQVSSQYLGKEVLKKIEQVITSKSGATMLTNFVRVDAQSGPALSGTYVREFMPHRHSYAIAHETSASLQKGIAKLNEYFTQINHTITQHQLLQFEHGDYTIVSENTSSPAGRLIIDLTRDWDEEWGGTPHFYEEGGFVPLPLNMFDAALIVEQPLITFIKYVNNLSNTQKRTLLLLDLEKRQS